MSLPTLDTAKVKLSDVAERISAHLKRFEKNPAINVPTNKLTPYWNSMACASGPRVFITYVSYQGSSSLKKGDAIKYLQKLDGGYVGKHYGALRE